MKSFLVLLMSLFATTASAQVKGILRRNADEVRLPTQALRSGQLAIGEEFVVTLPDANSNQPNLFDLDGKFNRTLPITTVACAAIVGKHLYLVSRANGLKVIDTASWKEVQELREPYSSQVTRLAATPDGSTVFALKPFAPATLSVLRRDSASGKLSVMKVFQGDEGSLALARATARSNPGALRIELIEGAVRTPHFDTAEDLAVSRDGKTLYVACFTNSLLAFAERSGSWELVDSVVDNVRGHHTMGLMMSKSVAPTQNGVFVGGIKRLAWFGFDGKTLSSKSWWVDDSEHPGHMKQEFPFIDEVVSLATSKSEKHLFVSSTHSPSIHVLEIGEDKLTPIGAVDSSRPTARMLDVKVTADGTRLFAKSTASQLEVYELGESFASEE